MSFSSSMATATTTRSDDLTIPELFRELKQRLSGISSNCIRCVSLINLGWVNRRLTLSGAVFSNSSGLDVQEVRGIDDEPRLSLINSAC